MKSSIIKLFRGRVVLSTILALVLIYLIRKRSRKRQSTKSSDGTKMKKMVPSKSNLSFMEDQVKDKHQIKNPPEAIGNTLEKQQTFKFDSILMDLKTSSEEKTDNFEKQETGFEKYDKKLDQFHFALSLKLRE